MGRGAAALDGDASVSSRPAEISHRPRFSAADLGDRDFGSGIACRQNQPHERATPVNPDTPPPNYQNCQQPSSNLNSSILNGVRLPTRRRAPKRVPTGAGD